MKILKVLKINLPVIYMFLLFSLFVNGEAMATTYYVSPTGSDSNSGSISAPFKTIQKAADVVKPGDTVIVKDGTYTGDSRVVAITRSGNSSAWITFKAQNKWGAVLDGENNTVNQSILIDSNASYIKIEDFEMKGSKSGIVIANASTSSNIIIYRNKIHDMGRRYLDPCVDYDGANVGQTGIYTGTNSSYVTIDSNVIYNIGRLPGGACATYSGWDYNHDHGVYHRADNSTIINNIFYDNKAGWSIQLDGRYTPEHVNIINNTFSGTNPQRDGHIVIWEDCNYIKIQNNISHSPRNYFIWDPYDSANYVTVNNNLVYGTNLASDSRCSDPHYSCSDNIIGQDPKLVDLASKNFRLQSVSSAIDKGIPAGINYDADGNPRDSAPDIGAYEYVEVYGDNTPPAAPKLY